MERMARLRSRKKAVAPPMRPMIATVRSAGQIQGVPTPGLVGDPGVWVPARLLVVGVLVDVAEVIGVPVAVPIAVPVGVTEDPGVLVAVPELAGVAEGWLVGPEGFVNEKVALDEI